MTCARFGFFAKEPGNLTFIKQSAVAYAYLPNGLTGFYPILLQHTNTILENFDLPILSKYSRILNSLKHKRYHKIWVLRQKKRNYFSSDIWGMLVGPAHRSFESTLQRINFAQFFRYSFDDLPGSRM